MYFPIGWPKVLDIPNENAFCSIRQVLSNRDKLFFAILSDDTLSIFFCKPCLPIVQHRRSRESIEDIGTNELVQWRPDSTCIAVTTSGGYLIIYKVVGEPDQKGLYQLVDSPQPNLRRDSAELFIKEIVPSLQLTMVNEVAVGEGGIMSMVCIRDELMLATTRGHVIRYRWEGTLNRDYCLDLRRVPFCVDQQVSKAVPILEENVYIIEMEYSPFIGGFAVVLSDGRAAFLTASTLMFDPNRVQGIWAREVEDATCAAVNHKYRLITYGRRNSQGIVYEIDESSGGLEPTHRLALSPQAYPGAGGGGNGVGHVTCLRWTPDGCALAMAWAGGGFSIWSTFGSLLACSLSWDYGLHVDLTTYNPLTIHAMEWSAEGYQLWMVKKNQNVDPHGPLQQPEDGSSPCTPLSSTSISSSVSSSISTSCGGCEDSVVQLGFLKSALTVNPSMSHQSHLYLQGEDRLYVNPGAGLTKVSRLRTRSATDSPTSAVLQPAVTTSLVESKAWTVVLIPTTYSATNWPIKYTAVDVEGAHMAVAGRCGLAHYSLATRKWKVFGNETQEKDMVVTGGLLWWNGFVVAGCYNIPDNRDEIRLYPRDTRLSNDHMTYTQVSTQLLLLDSLKDRLMVFTADSFITIYSMSLIDNKEWGAVDLSKVQIINICALCVHPACVVSVTLQSEPSRRSMDGHNRKDSFLINVSGRLLSVHQHDNNQSQALSPCALASCVENVWAPSRYLRNKPHLTEALWLFCGAHGMRVWLPLFPKDGAHKGGHTFMSKRVMLPFQLNIYPLAILFEDAILLGAENDTVLYSSDAASPFSLPFCTMERTSQVYLHQVLRQLIRRNLGYHAWEIARCCTGLPYFSHSLELLLHEVLEEEATSKEPIPDPQLPSVVEFIQEFPVYLQTVVQCARKTEVALWPYLFSAAGKPKDLFQQCLDRKELDTAASYLIILQNLESSSVSRQYATMLLDSTLENCKWELSKDLVRFLKSIDPNDVESPRTSIMMGPSGKYGMMPQTPSSVVAPDEEDLSLVLGSSQVSRVRSFSTTANPKMVQTPHTQVEPSHHIEGRKKSVPTGRVDTRENNNVGAVSMMGPPPSAEEFFMDLMVQRHARRLLSQHQLGDLGRMSAHLDFPLVQWLAREKERAARVDRFVPALRHLHADFNWPYPSLTSNTILTGSPYRKGSATSGSSVRSSPTIEEVVKGGIGDEGTVGSRVGDSGYMSQDHQHTPQQQAHPAGGTCTGNMYSARGTTHTPHTYATPFIADDRSVVSESESWFCGDEVEAALGMGGGSGEGWSDTIPSAQLLEQISQEVNASRGSPKAEVQLRYLLQLLMEAGCLEWSFLIAVVLRDALAVHRTTSMARSVDQSYEAVARLREGILSLHQWSINECLGYKPFMVAIHSNVVVLNRLLATKQRTATPPPATQPAPRSRTSSSTCETTSQPTISSGTPTEHHSAESTIKSIGKSDEANHHSRASPTPSQASLAKSEPSSCVIS